MEGKASIIPIYGMFTTDGCFRKAVIAIKENNNNNKTLVDITKTCFKLAKFGWIFSLKQQKQRDLAIFQEGCFKSKC